MSELAALVLSVILLVGIVIETFSDRKLCWYFGALEKTMAELRHVPRETAADPGKGRHGR